VWGSASSVPTADGHASGGRPADAVASRLSLRLSRPLTRLVEAAEQLGEGKTRIEPIRSELPEVDRVSAVLTRSAQQMTTSLAAEREFASDGFDGDPCAWRCQPPRGPFAAALFTARTHYSGEAVRTQVFTIGAGLKVTASAIGAALIGLLAGIPIRARLTEPHPRRHLSGRRRRAEGGQHNRPTRPEQPGCAAVGEPSDWGGSHGVGDIGVVGVVELHGEARAGEQGRDEHHLPVHERELALDALVDAENVAGPGERGVRGVEHRADSVLAGRLGATMDVVLERSAERWPILGQHLPPELPQCGGHHAGDVVPGDLRQ